MSKLSEEDFHLLEAALQAMKNAYVVWGFHVGAAVLGEDGKVYVGCNVESRISGLGVCAERCAIHHAVCHGIKKIRKIAIVIEDQNAERVVPCGACRQYIYDFSDGKAKIIMAKAKNGKLVEKSVETCSILDILPKPF